MYVPNLDNIFFFLHTHSQSFTTLCTKLTNIDPVNLIRPFAQSILLDISSAPPLPGGADETTSQYLHALRDTTVTRLIIPFPTSRAKDKNRGQQSSLPALFPFPYLLNLRVLFLRLQRQVPEVGLQRLQELLRRLVVRGATGRKRRRHFGHRICLLWWPTYPRGRRNLRKITGFRFIFFLWDFCTLLLDVFIYTQQQKKNHFKSSNFFPAGRASLTLRWPLIALVLLR